MRQGTSHWNVSSLSFVCDTCGGDLFDRYKQLIRVYAIDLATLSDTWRIFSEAKYSVH